MSTLGKRLRQARMKKGFTQEYVAEIIGVTYQTISNYERDEREPDIETLTKLANLYEVSVGWLVGQTSDPTPPRARPKEPDYDRYIRDAPTLPKGLERIAEVTVKYGLDLKESMRLSDLVFKKFGPPEVEYADQAAETKKKVPGTGVLHNINDIRKNRGKDSDDKH